MPPCTNSIYGYFKQDACILSVALSQHHLSGFAIAQLEFHHYGFPKFASFVHRDASLNYSLSGKAG